MVSYDPHIHTCAHTAFTPFDVPIFAFFASNDRKISRVGRLLMVGLPPCAFFVHWRHVANNPIPLTNHPTKTKQEMVEGWRAFTTAEFSIEQIQGNHLFVYDADARDSWFESITDALVAEGY